MPWLMDTVTERIETVLVHRLILDVMIREAVDFNDDVYTALDAWEKAGRPGRARKVQEDIEKIQPKVSMSHLNGVKTNRVLLY